MVAYLGLLTGYAMTNLEKYSGQVNQYQHFMKNMAIVGGALAFVAFGGGAYSLDASKSSKQLRMT
jgi:uncharacterized membrane protein YphA (DoxX/SURF4 family)